MFCCDMVSLAKSSAKHNIHDTYHLHSIEKYHETINKLFARPWLFWCFISPTIRGILLKIGDSIDKKVGQFNIKLQIDCDTRDDGTIELSCSIVYNQGSVDVAYSSNYKDDFQKLIWTINGMTTGSCDTTYKGGYEVILAEIDRLVESL